MFSKQKQRSWIKIECTRGRTARQCHQGLQQACGESALPYRTVARWVKAFNEGRQNVADTRRPGRPSVSEEVYALSALLESDRPRDRISAYVCASRSEGTPGHGKNCITMALRKKRRHFLQNQPIIFQDNARPHAAQAVADLFDRWGWEVLYHPPYSPDLSPCDFDLIPKMKEQLRGIRFRTVPGSRPLHSNYQYKGAAKGILRLPHRWQRVVHNAGDYTEG
ncbi:hypothetical protein B7P43_G03184 [Cryptotermes secundus]|uniref:Tc1-like transposase DDE domain-containing protein n=1 Tax=Cryptotermes secundus TaxID=105785 RepID=A0A2J7RTG0_9NEOP|nr:hypothetical protein B7P43_G03184 [Cryptotermes secundus]